MNVRIEDPESMNVLGLFLAKSLRRQPDACPLAGTLGVEAGDMRAYVRFDGGRAVVSRAAPSAASLVSGPLDALVAAFARPGLRSLLRIRVRGSRLFALRALKWLVP